MTSTQQKLQMLLDGKLDASELADDPALISLADRLYGIKIASAKPKKARDMVASPQSSEIVEVAPPTNMLIEVVAPINAPLPELEPLPTLPLVPENTGAKKMSLMSKLIIAELIVVILNIFGAFSYIL